MDIFHYGNRTRNRGALQLVVLFLAVLLMAVSAVGSASAKSIQDAEAFYKGKNLTLVVPYKPGGGYDCRNEICPWPPPFNNFSCG